VTYREGIVSMYHNPLLDYEEDEIKGWYKKRDFRPSGEGEGKMELA
jgi:hypothetical protein